MHNVFIRANLSNVQLHNVDSPLSTWIPPVSTHETKLVIGVTKDFWLRAGSVCLNNSVAFPSLENSSALADMAQTLDLH
jgi:hypothetical protein